MRTRQQIERYVIDHQKAGHFVMACLRNDLLAAVSLADEDNRAALADIVIYMNIHIPDVSWGSPAKVEAWLAAVPV